MSSENAGLTNIIHPIMQDPVIFTSSNARISLRRYQIGVIQSITDSVLNGRGISFIVMFPRQSGKNELQAQLEAYLLAGFCLFGAEIVKISPTWKPQSQNAMNRLETTLSKGVVTKRLWRKESGYIYRIGYARISFLSGEPQAHIVGATASLLLEVDEAQDVSISKYDKEIAPMAASTNATRVFWGTAWTTHTLLARELRLARKLEAQDGICRVFQIDGEQVAREVPPYDAFLREQVQRLGRFHPIIRTQFFTEEIDEDTGMFPLARQVLMHGAHPRQNAPEVGRIYAFLLDVGGEDYSSESEQIEENVNISTNNHDATALTIIEVDPSSLADEHLKAPLYRVITRLSWTGVSQPLLYQQIKALTDLWKPRRIIVDATGIGSGLAAFLKKAYPSRVKPFLFTSISKSNLGWDFLSVCDTGRFKDYAMDENDYDQRCFWQQVNACQMETENSPGHRIRWGVPDGTMDFSTQKPIHDDLLISAAMCALLDQEKWSSPSLSGGFIQARDPLDGMVSVF